MSINYTKTTDRHNIYLIHFSTACVQQLSCCGAKDYKDWSTTQFFTSGVVFPVNALRQVVPRSCCMLRHNLTDCNLGNADGVPLHLNLLFPTVRISSLRRKTVKTVTSKKVEVRQDCSQGYCSSRMHST